MSDDSLPPALTEALRTIDPGFPGERAESAPMDPVAAWATSGAMWLSRGPDGTPQVAPGFPASLVARSLRMLEVNIVAATVLGERAALAGLGPAGVSSAGGASRLVDCADGTVAISLARAGDADLVAAVIGETIAGDPWRALSRWSTTQTSAAFADRAQLLGLPACAVPVEGADPDEQVRARGGMAPVIATGGGERRSTRDRRPLIVDLSSLWAGPLCSHLLGLRGAEVVKVEGAARLDGARRGSTDFYDLLHGGHQSVTVDLQSPDDVARLRRLLDRADVVIEGSRPKALARLGINAHEVVAGGGIWLSITAYGRTGPWCDRVGLGDDVAAGAGMVGRSGGETRFLGDALADPMTGVVAALAISTALSSQRGWLLDVSMRDVVAVTLGAVPEHEVTATGSGSWQVITVSGRHDVLPPRPASPRGGGAPARAAGADNDRWLGRP